jgi:hypothetical protein
MKYGKNINHRGYAKRLIHQEYDGSEGGKSSPLSLYY